MFKFSYESKDRLCTLYHTTINGETFLDDDFFAQWEHYSLNELENLLVSCVSVFNYHSVILHPPSTKRDIIRRAVACMNIILREDEWADEVVYIATKHPCFLLAKRLLPSHAYPEGMTGFFEKVEGRKSR